MFANLLHLISRRPPPEYERGFVREVNVSHRAPRSRRTQWLLLAGWLLIAAKSWLIVWAVDHYHVPVNPLWVIVPTVIFAAVCTLVYFLWP
jgi:membrane protein YdbS with pleckstrin-like domain